MVLENEAHKERASKYESELFSAEHLIRNSNSELQQKLALVSELESKLSETLSLLSRLFSLISNNDAGNHKNLTLLLLNSCVKKKTGKVTHLVSKY